MVYLHNGILLTKLVKDLYTENSKTLMKQIEKDMNTWKDILCSWNNWKNYNPKLSIDTM